MNDIKEKNVSFDEEIISTSDSRFEELIRERADAQIPESLMPENIYKLLDDAEKKVPEKKKSSKVVYIAIFAAAAVLFLVMGIYLISELAIRNKKLFTLGFEPKDSINLASDSEKTAGDEMTFGEEAAEAYEESADDSDSDTLTGAFDQAVSGDREYSKAEMKGEKTVIDDEDNEYTYIINTEKGLIEIHKKGIPEEKGLLSTIRVMVYNQGEAVSIKERTSVGRVFIDIIIPAEGEGESEKTETYDITDPKTPVHIE